MHKFLSPITLLIISFFTSIVLADVSIIAPLAFTLYTPDDTGMVNIDIQWIDNGATPLQEDITYFTFTLETGANDAIQPVKTLAKRVSLENVKVVTDALDNTIYSYSVSFSSSVYGNGQFYIQVFAMVQSQGNTIHYTPRFFLQNMTGKRIASITDTIEPQPQTAIAAAGQTQATIDSRSFTVPYTKQTGISRFAPMQTQPPKKMSLTKWTRKYLTSAVTFFKSARKSLDQSTTITPGKTYTFTSDVNYATPALFPSQNGGWYHPSKRQSLSPRKVNANKITKSTSSSTA